MPVILHLQSLIYYLNIRRVYSLGQKVLCKFTKLSKIGFSMECFTAGFLQFFISKHQNLVLGLQAEYSSPNSSLSGILLKFPNLLRSQVLSRSATREATGPSTVW